MLSKDKFFTDNDRYIAECKSKGLDWVLALPFLTWRKSLKLLDNLKIFKI